MDYRIEALTSDHLSVAQFDCGHGNSLGSWLEDKALGYQKEHLCRVHVMIDEKNSDRLCGFFTLSAHQIITEEIARKDRRDDPKNGSIAGSLEGHPSLLLGKFALDRDYQGARSVRFSCISSIRLSWRRSTIPVHGILLLRSAKTLFEECIGISSSLLCRHRQVKTVRERTTRKPQTFVKKFGEWMLPFVASALINASFGGFRRLEGFPNADPVALVARGF